MNMSACDADVRTFENFSKLYAILALKVYVVTRHNRIVHARVQYKHVYQIDEL
jgi:hypothetical protein